MNATLATAPMRELLTDLPFLIAVADEGGITAAADVLGVPQPTVSRAMARLGRRLGAPLLRRDGRGVRLTPSGTTFLAFARSARTAALEGFAAVQRDLESARATVGVAFQHTLGRTVVPALVRALLAERVGTRVDLRQGSRDSCLELFDRRAVDAVLVSPPLTSEATTRTLHLYTEPLALATPLDHPLARRPSVRLADLAGEPLLAMEPGYGLRAIVDDLLGEAGIDRVFAFEGEDVQTLRGLVSAGLGVAILPVAGAALTDVVEVPISDPGARREVGVSWHEEATDPLSAAFVLQDLLTHSRSWTAGLARPPAPAAR